MKAKELLELMPEKSGYELCNANKNLLEKWNGCVSIGLSVRDHEFYENEFEPCEPENRIYVEMEIGIKSKYSHLSAFKSCNLWVYNGALDKNKEIAFAPPDNVLYLWKLDDIQGLKADLKEIIVPKMDWLSQPQVLLKMMNCVRNYQMYKGESQKIAGCDEFYSIMKSNALVRWENYKNFEDVFATLSERIGDWESSLRYLEALKEKKVSEVKKLENSKSKEKVVKEWLEGAKKDLGLVLDGIERMKCKLGLK